MTVNAQTMLELADKVVGIQEYLPNEDDRNALGQAAHYLRKAAALRSPAIAGVETELEAQHNAQLEGLAIGLEQRGEKSAAHIIRLALNRLAALPPSQEVPAQAQEVCDCQQPEEIDGLRLISNSCPVHNDNPDPPPPWPDVAAQPQTAPDPAAYWQMMYTNLLKRVDAGEFAVPRPDSGGAA